MNRLLACLLLALAPLAVAQDSRKAITNADVVSMSRAGLKEQTIVLAIEQGPTSFDTSPQELIALKKAGVSDAVLNAMLATSKNSTGTAVVAASGNSSDNHLPGTPTALKLFERALLAVAPKDKLTSINATRQLSTTTQNRSASTTTSETERIIVYPDRLYAEVHPFAGPVTKLVLTPQFAYSDNGQGRRDLPDAMAEDLRTGMKFEVPYVAQHMREFTFAYDGQDTIDAEKCDRLRIKHSDGKQEVWSIDQSGKIRRMVAWLSSGEVSTEFSDFRFVDGVNIPFHRRSTGGYGTTETTVKLYQVNPPRYEINSALFDIPTD